TGTRAGRRSRIELGTFAGGVTANPPERVVGPLERRPRQVAEEFVDLGIDRRLALDEHREQRRLCGRERGAFGLDRLANRGVDVVEAPPDATSVRLEER